MVSRVLTAIALIFVVVGALLSPSPWPFAAAMLVATGLCAYEATELVGSGKSPALPSALWTVAFVGTIWWISKGATATATLGVVLGLTVIGVMACWKQVRWFAGAYPAGALAALAALQFQPHSGLPLALAVLVPIWAGDTFAMFAGRKFGKTPLAPALSPKKTLEGAIANLIASVVASLALGPYVGLPVPVALAIGVSAGVVGQGGDLFESFLKRRAGTKDSGSLLPGHGGVFDRIDALLPHAAVSYCILLLTLK